MPLFAIILAASLERTLNLSREWSWRRLLLRWQHLQFSKTQLQDWKQNGLGQLGWMLLPAFIIGFVLALFDNLLLSFIVSTGLLLVSMTCASARQSYKSYLAAAAQLDHADLDHAERSAAEQTVAASLTQLRKVSGRKDAPAIEHALLWIHLRYYFAVLLYFVLFGIIGALVYATLRDMRKPRHFETESWQRGQYLIDWLPTRVMALGFLFVGNFSKSAGLWLSTLGNIPADNFSALTNIAEAAEELRGEDIDRATTALTTVNLIKRNLLLFIVFISILTIAGWL